MRSADGPCRVLLVAPTFGAYGGMEAFTLDLAEAVRLDRRFDLRVCFKQALPFRLDAALAERARDLGAIFCARGSRALWSAIRWAEIVHGQSASPDIAAMATLQRKPIVLSIHNVLSSRSGARRLLWAIAARFAHARWYNSQFVWRTWEPRNVMRGSACVYPLSRRWDAEVRNRERKGFVFLGRLVEGKGADLLLEAYARVGLDRYRWPLMIVGDGPLRQRLEARARQIGIDIRFTGFVDGPEKAEIIAGARWLVVPSHWQEPFGLVAHEARSLGVPCIATRDGGLPEAVGRDALICEPADVDSLAARLRQAVEMDEDDYWARSRRTRFDLGGEIAPPEFYAAAYLSVLGATSELGSTPLGALSE